MVDRKRLVIRRAHLPNLKRDRWEQHWGLVGQTPNVDGGVEREVGRRPGSPTGAAVS